MAEEVGVIGGEQEFERQRASWLELFYDLAYVAAIAQLTYLLISAEGTLIEYAQFLLIFLMVFLSWLGAVIYRNFRGELDDGFERVATIIQMFFALIMSVFLQEAFGAGAVGFIIGYVGTRIVWQVLLVRSYILEPETAPESYNIVWSTRVAIVVWLASLFVPQPFQTLMWVVALGIELLAPYTRGITKPVENKIRTLNKFHLPERFGLFTILVMGESFIVVAVVNNIADGIITPINGLIATATFLMIAGLWWLYFTHVERFAMGRRFRLFSYIYTHLPILIGIMLIAVGTKVGMLGKAYGTDPFTLIAAGLIFTLIGFNVMKFATGQRAADLFWPTAVFVGLIIVGVYINTLPFLYSLFVLAAFFFGYILFENKQCGKHCVKAKQPATELQSS